MCTETFLRLPEEKRTRFLDAAWEEFTRVPFSEASINQIVRRANIPRGSFYQYFTDKKELFFHLLGGMMNYLLKEYGRMIEEAGGDIFQTQLRCFDRVLLEKNTHPLFRRGMEVLEKNPVFLMQAMAESRAPYRIWEAVRDHADLSAFRDGSAELCREVFVMSLIDLVLMMSESMRYPERVEACRNMLLLRLDVLKRGSLMEEIPSGCKEAL